MSHKRTLPLLLAIAAPFAATAQDTTTADAPTGWTGTGELGLALARGNARSESVNARLAFGKEDVRWKHDFHASALRSKGEVTGDFDGDGAEEERYELSANRYEFGASSAYKFDPRNYIVGAARYENDDFSPYDYQAIASVGYGHKFVDSERTSLSTEIGPGFRRARDAETGLVESGVVGRGLVEFKHQLTANTEIYDTFLVEAGSDNTFMQNDIGIAVAMNEKFALKAGLQARRNSDVEPGTKNTDTLTTINLVYKIQ
jgi:putative salt-induced outer membrane protein